MDTNESFETTRATILVVDDDPASLSAFGRILRRHYEVLAAPSGTRALEIAEGHPKLDLILLDVLMPDLDGLQVLKRLQENPLTRRIPVIFVTVMDTMDDHAEALRAGAADFITKPFSPDLVLARIAAHLTLKKVTDELAVCRESVEAEVERRTGELRQAKEVSEAESRAKSEFLIALGHELRTSLNNALGIVQLQRIFELSDEQQGDVQISISSARSLLSIVNNMQDPGVAEDNPLASPRPVVNVPPKADGCEA